MNIKNIAQTYFTDCGFCWREGVPIVSANPKLLFNISGGVIFEDAISHEEPLENRRIASIQTCLRTDGWEKIGISGRHHLAFDMLGHFSIYESDEYETKERMIIGAWRFLTLSLGIPTNQFFATVHVHDLVSQNIWCKLGVKVVLNSENTTVTPEKNRCGFRTEIVWVNPNNGRYMELWNLVFTQFEGDSLMVPPLDRVAADSGASIDRIITALECCENDYENSLWKNEIYSLIKISRFKEKSTIYRLADFGKAIVLLVSQGLLPGNKAADYVLRKIIREAYIICMQSSIFFTDFINISIRAWVDDQKSLDSIINVLVDEAKKFELVIARGQKEYFKIVSSKNGPLCESDIEYLSSTIGYPRALIKAEEKKRREGLI